MQSAFVLFIEEVKGINETKQHIVDKISIEEEKAIRMLIDEFNNIVKKAILNAISAMFWLPQIVTNSLRMNIYPLMYFQTL